MLRPPACNPVKYSSALFTLDDTAIQLFYKESGTHLYAVRGLQLDPNDQNQSPCPGGTCTRDWCHRTPDRSSARWHQVSCTSLSEENNNVDVETVECLTSALRDSGTGNSSSSSAIVRVSDSTSFNVFLGIFFLSVIWLVEKRMPKHVSEQPKAAQKIKRHLTSFEVYLHCFQVRDITVKMDQCSQCTTSAPVIGITLDVDGTCWQQVRVHGRAWCRHLLTAGACAWTGIV